MCIYWGGGVHSAAGGREGGSVVNRINQFTIKMSCKDCLSQCYQGQGRGPCANGGKLGPSVYRTRRGHC